MMKALKKFNMLCENIIFEFRDYGRIRLPEKDRVLITKLADEMREDMRKELSKDEDIYLCWQRFNSNDRIIIEVEDILSHPGKPELADQLLVKVDPLTLDKAKPKRELKSNENIIPLLKEIIIEAFKKAAITDKIYDMEKDSIWR